MYTNPSDSTKEVPMCQDYKNYMFVSLAIGQSITGFIVVVNLILKTLTISLITWIGYDTHSEMITKITNGVFIAQFFNTGLVLLLVEANFTETFTFASGIFEGQFSDYSESWYQKVGYTLTQTMIINAGMPVATQVIGDVMKWFFQRMD